MVLAGVRVASLMEGRFVGNGCTDEMPSVSSVVMTEPLVLATLSMPKVDRGV